MPVHAPQIPDAPGSDLQSPHVHFQLRDLDLPLALPLLRGVLLVHQRPLCDEKSQNEYSVAAATLEHPPDLGGGGGDYNWS